MAWQLIVSLSLAVIAVIVAGWHGFLSAMLGGSIGVIGVLVFALVSRRAEGDSRSVIRIALRAEAAKMLVIVVLLWLAFVAYHKMVVLAFLGAFAVSVLLSGLAFAVSGNQLTSQPISNSSKV
ncbi:MAG: ATP synthase subunit I [Zoogloeaceae bacterium]|jgi:ATP synthase protein I|nr:ATP synthase subunit I [Zoogloeaceae bacterium]